MTAQNRKELSQVPPLPQIQCRNLKIKAICGAASMIHQPETLQQFFQVGLPLQVISDGYRSLLPNGHPQKP